MVSKLSRLELSENSRNVDKCKLNHIIIYNYYGLEEKDSHKYSDLIDDLSK